MNENSEIFKKLRKEKKLTQIELSNILGLDQTTISKWELGKAFPDIEMLIKLSDFFDVSIDFLLGKSSYYYPDRVTSHSLPTESQLTADEQELLSIYRKLLPNYRAAVLQNVKLIAGDLDKTASKKKA